MTLPIASPSHRFVAWLVDTFLYIFLLLSTLIAVFSASALPSLLTAFLHHLILIWLVTPVIYPFFTSFTTSIFGGTPGKIITGLSVVNSQGQRLSFWRAFFRNDIGYLISGLFLNLGFVWILFDRQRRGWHDQIAGSFVIVSRKHGLILGLLASVSLLIANVWLLSTIIVQFTSHLPLYQEIVRNSLPPLAF